MFILDERIQSTSVILGDWPLSRVLLKNEAGYPWFLLVPRKQNVQELFQLNRDERALLMEEINQLSLLITDYYKPEKLNVATLGNIVSQLHVHIVVRTRSDELWPQGIWQASFKPKLYQPIALEELAVVLSVLVKHRNGFF